MAQKRYTIQQHHINIRFPIRLSHINAYHCDSSVSNILPSHPHTIILFVRKGSGKLHYKHSYLALQENTLFILNPDNQKVSIELNQPSIDFITLNVENLYFYENNTKLSSPYTKYFFHGTKCRNIIEMLLNEVECRDMFFEEACHYYLNLLLIHIQRETGLSFDCCIKDTKKRDCEYIKEYIDAHFTENITLDLLSEKGGMNKYYLVHSFSKNYGRSPINYLNEKRIDESKKMLEITDYSIAKISKLIGFSSQSYFSQAFKKHTFMTPNEYRHLSKNM